MPWLGRDASRILAHCTTSRREAMNNRTSSRAKKSRETFLACVESAVVRYGVVVHTWCLMRNHDYLLLETPSSNLAQIMRYINGASTTYVNVTRKRAGHLFQGQYQAILVEADAYALARSCSMPLNPVSAGMVA
jgi:putative transposase